MDIPKRKPNRLPDFDYSTPGAYFITISTVIQQFKGIVTKRIGQSIWQKLYHDHVVRGERDYLKIWEYIDNNPARWTEDCFYMEDSE